MAKRWCKSLTFTCDRETCMRNQLIMARYIVDLEKGHCRHLYVNVEHWQSGVLCYDYHRNVYRTKDEEVLDRDFLQVFELVGQQ